MANTRRKAVARNTRLFDDVDPATRHVMSCIRSTETAPERAVRSILHALGYRFRKNYGRLPGRPDIAFPSRRTAIFVHGCFWHFHDNCRSGKIPRTRTEYWREKLTRNKARDQTNKEMLERLGWKTFVIWECQKPADWLEAAKNILGPPGKPHDSLTKRNAEEK
jgi:DNA mismatch endonuclease, patch repair protein